MRVAGTIALLVGGLCAACGGDDDAGPIDAGGTVDGGSDAGSDGGVPDPDGGPPDAGSLGAPGAPCASNDECESGSCVELLEAFDLGTGYCTEACTADADCAFGDGYEYSCLSYRGTDQCIRTCNDGFGCPESDACLNWTLDTVPADVCVDVAADRCTSEADCEAGDHCMPTIADRERVHVLCFTPINSRGVPRTSLLHPGDACDPRSGIYGQFAVPCAVATDCPSGWLCTARSTDGRRVCTAPDAETCGWFCQNEGVCAGVCEEDADCPTDMLCHRAVFASIDHGSPSAHDDGPFEVGVCNYAVGSRTPCTREADCATTGAGGTAERCRPGFDAEGMPRNHCLAQPEGIANLGEACGDDPTTDEFEARPCFGFCGAGTCMGSCATDADCATGSECISGPVTQTQSVQLCAPTPTCTRDADCAAGQVCHIGISDDGARDFCGPPIGSLAPGATCDVGDPRFFPVAARCGLTCNDVGEGSAAGRCTSLCASDTDCPMDHVCSRVRMTSLNRGTPDDRTDDLVAERAFCAYVPGSRSSCTTDAACPTGESCVHLTDSTGTEQRWCITEVTGGAATGETCNPTTPCANRASCFIDWWDPTDSYCTALCDSDADCTGGLVCRRFSELPDPDITLQLCLRPEDPRGEAL